MSAIEKLAHAISTADIQGDDSLWRIEFVSGNGAEINSQSVDVDRDFPRGLYGVGVEVDVGFLGDAADFFERLDGAELVVGVHDGDQNGFRPDGAAQILEINLSFAISRQIGDASACFFECLAGVENSFVFDGGGVDAGWPS